MENPSETKEKFREEISELKKKIQKLVKSESQHNHKRSNCTQMN